MKSVRSFSSISNTAKYMRSGAVTLTQIGYLLGVLMTPAVTPSQKKLNLYQQLKQQLNMMNADEISSAFICVYLLISAVKKTPNPKTSPQVKTTEAKF